ncbi:hypothetical protein OG713_19920 [Streptomyces sp. NBC_00723]|uniref:RNA polymerase sigma factor n=1 Tax=Streptomyces sp. NBC_00723 TaxID=2903673 RepID=UPI003866A0A1
MEIFRKAYEEHRAELLARLDEAGLAKSDRDDVLQDAAADVWADLEGNIDVDTVKTLLNAAVAKRINSRRYTTRKQKKNESSMDYDLADPARADGPLDDSTSPDGPAWQLMEKILKGRQLRAMQLRYGSRLSVDEIADFLGIKKTTVKIHIFRARKALDKHRDAFRGYLPPEIDEEQPPEIDTGP